MRTTRTANRDHRMHARSETGKGTALRVVLALLLPAAAAGQVANTLTLDEAVERALRANPQMVQASTTLGTAEFSVRQTWASFLPSLSVSTGASVSASERFNPQTNTVVSSPSSDNYNARFNSSLDIFTGGRRGAELRSARADARAAEAGLVEQRFAVTLQVKQAFFNVLRAEEQIQVGEVRVELAEEGLAAAERRLSVGSATRSDVLRARLELTDARQTLLDARAQKRTAAYALGRLVGVEGPVEPRLLEPLEPEPLAVDRDELTELALARSPAVAAARADAEAGDAGLSAARAQWFPSLSAGAGYTVANDDPTLSQATNSWSLSLGLSYPIFNGLSREASIERARATATVAEARLADARRQTRAEVERLVLDVEVTAERVALLRESVEVAEEDLRVQRERYRLGASTILDQITSQLNLIQAEMSLIAARYDYQIARAELEALVGREL